ncbi:alcohol acetyltransferase-domain-containing protein [Thelonectria olida]|uniref:Alcohol acetyltransferase-domain-containing protein n=1 Tax=Thelonectria olida TaxID=1576542 RepID=A0A9P8WIZ5_9HYPO|nr:alcohol acetyltransferase-domain-containing protein [Thelonectria olida]
MASETSTNDAPYTIVRDSSTSTPSLPTKRYVHERSNNGGRLGFYDRIFYMVHRLGLQANILVSARYAPSDQDSGHGRRLSRDAVVAALRSVVEVHSALRMIAVIRKEGRDSKHYVKLGMLKSIDLGQCIEFVDDLDSVGTDFFEKIHNTWEWFEEEPSGPWWRVYVVGGRDVVWVSHHVLCDANSGIPFHRTFLHGLNSYATEKPTSVDPIISLDPVTAPLFPEPMTLSKHEPSILELIWTNVKRLFVRVMFGSSLMFISLPEPKPYFKSITEVAPPEMRTVTCVSAIRIPAEKMDRILTACRANGTTFTGLLMVMLLATFSVDLFPDDRVGCSLFAFDIRRHLRMPKLDPVLARDGIMLNGGSGGFLTHWLRNYRKVVTTGDKDNKSTEGPSVNAKVVWELARWYKQAMVRGIPNRYMRGWMAGGLLGQDLEGFVGRILGGIGRVTGKSFLCSNLGAFDFNTSVPRGEDVSEQQPWTVKDLQFSASCVNGNVGSRGFVFNVVGVKGADTVIHLSYEKGVVSRELAEDSLRFTMDKIDSLLAGEDRAVLAASAQE